VAFLLSAGPWVRAEVFDEEDKAEVRPPHRHRAVPSTGKGETLVIRAKLHRRVDEPRASARERQHHSQNDQKATDEEYRGDPSPGVDSDGVAPHTDDHDSEADPDPGDDGSLPEEAVRFGVEVEIERGACLASRLASLWF